MYMHACRHGVHYRFHACARHGASEPRWADQQRRQQQILFRHGPIFQGWGKQATEVLRYIYVHARKFINIYIYIYLHIRATRVPVYLSIL